MSTNHNQYPANALWVELSTRITTQSLHYPEIVNVVVASTVKSHSGLYS